MKFNKCLECGGDVSEAGPLYNEDGEKTGYGVQALNRAGITESNVELVKEINDLQTKLTAAEAVVKSLHDKGWPVDGCTCDTCESLRKLQGGE